MKLFRFKSIRGQLTFGLLAALGPCLAVGFLATQELARSRIYSLTERRLQAEGQLISYGLEQWGLGIRNLAEILAETPAFVEGDLREVGSVFRSLNRENPHRLWRLWSASNQPKILAFSGTISPQQKAAAEASQSQRDYFQAALRGYATYQVVMSRTTGRACLNVSQPVFANNQLLQNHQHARRFSVPTPELLCNR